MKSLSVSIKYFAFPEIVAQPPRRALPKCLSGPIRHYWALSLILNRKLLPYYFLFYSKHSYVWFILLAELPLNSIFEYLEDYHSTFFLLLQETIANAFTYTALMRSTCNCMLPHVFLQAFLFLYWWINFSFDRHISFPVMISYRIPTLSFLSFREP